MDETAYDIMNETEGSHWWFRAKREIVLTVLDHMIKQTKEQTSLSVVDIGCGTGAILNELADKFPNCTLSGMDYSETALNYCKKKFNGKLSLLDLSSQTQELPQTPFDFVIVLDILEHIEDQEIPFTNIRNMLKTTGKCILTVPAYPSMWSNHDIWLGHKRRYTKQQLIELVNKNKLQLEFISYYNCFLFPAMWLVRILSKWVQTDTSASMESKLPPVWINTMLYHIFRSEKKLLAKRRTFPFGGSLLCILTNNV